MVFRRLRKRGRDRARSSERRRLGKAFQKDGPTTAKLLRWAVASLTLGTTRSPCSAERRDLRPGKDDTPGHRAPLDKPGTFYILSFSRLSSFFLIISPKYVSFLFLIDSRSCLSASTVFSTHSFVFSLT